ncbi:MAG: hypothetical protein V6Z89_14395 [Desulfobacter sp.]
MKKLPKSYDYFITALEHAKALDSVGFQNRLSLKIEKSEGYISQIFNRKAIASFNLQNEISEACGFDYEEFLALGKNLSQGKESEVRSEADAVNHLDPALQILHEALEESQVEISEKQKEACLEIIREELGKSNARIKDDIKKYLKAFGE